ncbi:hypothetical protein C5L14_08730 [Labrys okinawensis]|uniref:Uncharacterized protein n=2 Tax=Xanthobacteraceae TaxID=335928 RepID=A0A2S9QF45_9HYPH|nr:hypothetical protein C5L14_08730 [Labrys okinawensis]
MIAALMFAGASASGAAAAQAGPQTLRLAPLQIMCFRAPCPWGEMAIRPVDALDTPHPLYRGPLPRLQARPGDAAVIRRAWQRRTCLIIRGSVEGASLRVFRILDRC